MKKQSVKCSQSKTAMIAVLTDDLKMSKNVFFFPSERYFYKLWTLKKKKLLNRNTITWLHSYIHLIPNSLCKLSCAMGRWSSAPTVLSRPNTCFTYPAYKLLWQLSTPHKQHLRMDKWNILCLKTLYRHSTSITSDNVKG